MDGWMPARGVLVGAVMGAATGIGIESFRLVTAAPAFSAAGAAPLGPVVLLVAGWAAVAAGLLQQWRFPVRRSWALLVAAGLALFIAEWDSPAAAAPVVFSAGLLLNAAVPAVIVHLALCFPSGRLGARLDRAVVASGYAIAVGMLGVAVAATFDPASLGCGCPSNLWLVDDNAQLSSSLSLLGLRCGLVWTASAGLVLVWRLVGSSAARRRSAGPMWALAIADLLAVAASYRHGLARHFVGSDVIQGQLWLAQAVALLLLAVVSVFALIRSRRSQRSLTRLVLDLGTVTHPGQLRAALAERLGDQEIVVAYPVDDGQRHVDADARDVDLTDLRADLVRTSLTYDGSEIAVIVHRRKTLDTPEAVGELVSAVHLALEHERLHAQALTQLDHLRSSGRRILAAGDDERRQLEHDLHDGAQQRLIGLALGLRLVRSQATTAKNNLDLAESEIREAIADLRRIARGLYPVVLRESGLAPAFAALAEHRLLRIGSVPDTRYPPVVESTVYRLVGLATEYSPAAVSIDEQDATVTAHIDIEGELPDIAEVRDRAATLNGQLTVSGGGASPRITLILPIPCGLSA
jgi:signal transduction histidine kinase